jgi:hypothetical protein
MTRMLVTKPDPPTIEAIAWAAPDPSTKGVASIPSRPSTPWKVMLQPEYNLYDRASYDGALRDLAIREGLGVVVHYSPRPGMGQSRQRLRSPGSLHVKALPRRLPAPPA